VPTKNIRVAPFKVPSGTGDYVSSLQKRNRSCLGPSSGVKPPVTLRQGKRRVEKPPTRTGRASVSNTTRITKQMRKIVRSLKSEETIFSVTSATGQNALKCKISRLPRPKRNGKTHCDIERVTAVQLTGALAQLAASIASPMEVEL